MEAPSKKPNLQDCTDEVDLIRGGGGDVEEDERFKGDSLYLTYGELKFVKQNDKNIYFDLRSLGIEPFRFYKNGAQDFLGKLSSHTLPAALKMEEAALTRKLDDGEFSEHTLSEGRDEKSGARFRVKLAGQIYNGKPSIYVRTYVFLDHEDRWQATTRGVRLAISQEEADAMRDFIDAKLKKVAKPHPKQFAREKFHPPKVYSESAV